MAERSRKAHLQAVEVVVDTPAVRNEDPEPPAPLTVVQAAKSGDHRALLVSMRDRISTTVADPMCPPRDLAALTRRLQDIAKEIAAMDAQRRKEGDEGGPIADEAWDEAAV